MAGRLRWTLEAHQMLLLGKHQVNDEHLPFIVDLLDVRPLEVVGLATALEGKDACMVDAQVQLVPLVVLDRMWVHAICIEETGLAQEIGFCNSWYLAPELCLVNFGNLLLQARGLLQKKLELRDIVVSMLLTVVISKFRLNDQSSKQSRVIWRAIEASMKQVSSQLKKHLVPCYFLLESEWVLRIELDAEAEHNGIHAFDLFNHRFREVQPVPLLVTIDISKAKVVLLQEVQGIAHIVKYVLAFAEMLKITLQHFAVVQQAHGTLVLGIDVLLAPKFEHCGSE